LKSKGNPKYFIKLPLLYTKKDKDNLQKQYGKL